MTGKISRLKGEGGAMNHVIAYDLGTGGIKTTLFDERGNIVKSVFEQCETYYAGKDIREQNPLEWWELLVKTTRAVMEVSGPIDEKAMMDAVNEAGFEAVSVE